MVSHRILNPFRALLGMFVLNIFPAILVISDANLIKFILPYSLIYIPFFVVAILILLKQNFHPQSLLGEMIVAIPFLMPLFITVAYPFTMTSFILLVALVTFSLALPLWNVSLTKWFYTLGGLVPLPTDVSVILEGKPTGFGVKRYQQYVQKASVIYPILILAVLIVYKRINNFESLMVFIVQTGLFICLFGIFLAIGVALKKALHKPPFSK